MTRRAFVRRGSARHRAPIAHRPLNAIEAGGLVRLPRCLTDSIVRIIEPMLENIDSEDGRELARLWRVGRMEGNHARLDEDLGATPHHARARAQVPAAIVLPVAR